MDTKIQTRIEGNGWITVKNTQSQQPTMIEYLSLSFANCPILMDADISRRNSWLGFTLS